MNNAAGKRGLEEEPITHPARNLGSTNKISRTLYLIYDSRGDCAWGTQRTCHQHSPTGFLTLQHHNAHIYKLFQPPGILSDVWCLLVRRIAKQVFCVQGHISRSFLSRINDYIFPVTECNYWSRLEASNMALLTRITSHQRISYISGRARGEHKYYQHKELEGGNSP